MSERKEGFIDADLCLSHTNYQGYGRRDFLKGSLGSTERQYREK